MAIELLCLTTKRYLCLSLNLSQTVLVRRFPEMGVPPVIIHFHSSILNHPAIGVAPWLWTLDPVIFHPAIASNFFPRKCSTRWKSSTSYWVTWQLGETRNFLKKIGCFAEGQLNSRPGIFMNCPDPYLVGGWPTYEIPKCSKPPTSIFFVFDSEESRGLSTFQVNFGQLAGSYLGPLGHWSANWLFKVSWIHVVDPQGWLSHSFPWFSHWQSPRAWKIWGTPI